MTRLSDNYNLQKLCPDLAKEWHPTKNDTLTPRDVTPNSHKKVWWLCSKGHNWVAVISNRNNSTGCPYCSGRKVCLDNCLQIINPFLAKEWHPTKNGKLSSRDVTPNSGRRAWWLCSKDKNHEWNAIIGRRNKGSNCPYCRSTKKVCIDTAFKPLIHLLPKNGKLKQVGIAPVRK